MAVAVRGGDLTSTPEVDIWYFEQRLTRRYMEIQHKTSMRQRCVLKHGILKEFLAEFLGTFVLVVS